MYTHLLKKIVFFSVIFFAVMSIGNCASYKVYSVNAEALIKYAQAQGQKMHAKKLSSSSDCKIQKNILLVGFIKNSQVVSRKNAECLFTLFERNSLHKGWKVQSIVAASNGRGEWQYLINPKGKMSLLTMIKSDLNKSEKHVTHTIKMTKFVLLGPKSSKNWQEAISKVN